MMLCVPTLVLFLASAQLGIYPGPDATSPGYSVIQGSLTEDYVIIDATIIATDVSEAMLNVEFAVEVNGLADATVIGGSDLGWGHFCGDGAVWELDGTSCGGAPIGPADRIPILRLQIEGRPLVAAPTLCLVPPSATGPSFYSSPPTVSYVGSFGPPAQWVAFHLIEGGCTGPGTTVSAGSMSWSVIKGQY
jgi:hypothetical protein